MNTLRIPGFNDRAERMFGDEAQQYRPRRGSGSFDGYDTATDLLLGMLSSQQEEPHRNRPSFQANTVQEERTTSVPSSDEHLDASGLGDERYMAWTLSSVAQELGIRGAPTGESASTAQQVRFLQETMRQLEARPDLDEREQELLRLIPLFLARATGG